ncbi:hypothetical protein VSDG_09495 [Cytospora chrysosperma]|uniref:Uncharacterized protein n=1 Tax=Cytospora chrysosperma TaxID=252740 RepID=A0A423VCY9_CYTCH|nr:hypothetical protein VSDG_09495 [Valsa sordida]
MSFQLPPRPNLAEVRSLSISILKIPPVKSHGWRRDAGALGMDPNPRIYACESALSYIPTSVASSASFASRAAVSAPSAPKSIIHKSDKVSTITTHRSQASSPGSTAKYEHISHPRLAEAPRPSPPSQSCRSARQVDINCQRE